MDGGIPESPRVFEALASEFRGRAIGHTIVWHGATGSTMDDARRLGATGAAEGVVVGADRQSAGRGRHGRRWVSRPGEDLLFSVILRPNPERASRLSMLAGLVCANAVDRLTGGESTIKWPNDVRIGGRKVCGVLVESAIAGPSVAAVIGIGLNVNLDPTAWLEISTVATSLAHELGRTQSRVQALRSLLDEMNRLHGLLTSGDGLRERWAARVETVGRSVELVVGGEVVRGFAEGIDYDGGLVVRCENGSTRKFAAGEVTLQSPR